MSEYSDIGPADAGPRESAKKTSAEREIIPGTKVRVYTGLRNDPTANTWYEFVGMVDTQDGPKAKLAFKNREGKTFYRVAHYDDLVAE